MRKLAIWIALATLVMVSCDGGEPSEPTGDGGIQTLSPGELPTASPGSATGNLAAGSATLVVTGGAAANVSFASLGPAIAYAPGAEMNVTWASPSDPGAALTVSGAATTGDFTTSSEFRLAFSFTGADGVHGFSSSAGECTVTIDQAAEHTLGGRFSCGGLEGDVLTVDASGTFLASG